MTDELKHEDQKKGLVFLCFLIFGGEPTGAKYGRTISPHK